MGSRRDTTFAREPANRNSPYYQGSLGDALTRPLEPTRGRYNPPRERPDNKRKGKKP